MGKMSQILNYDFLPEQASLLPTRDFACWSWKKNTIVAAHTWTGLNVSFVRFYIFIDLDFVSVGKNGPKKNLANIRFLL